MKRILDRFDNSPLWIRLVTVLALSFILVAGLYTVKKNTAAQVTTEIQPAKKTGALPVKKETKEDLKRGLSPKVEKIILSGLTKVPEIISEKVEIIDFKKLWKKKTEIQKQKIYNFFGMETADIEKISRKKVIFLSQPLEEDESLTHEETVELYRKIFKNYNENDILFKLHPRGIFTYKNEFPQIEIFTSKIPFQIFEYMGVDFDTVATIYSTAVWDIKNAKKIDFFGTKVHPKLLAQFGNIER